MPSCSHQQALILESFRRRIVQANRNNELRFLFFIHQVGVSVVLPISKSSSCSQRCIKVAHKTLYSLMAREECGRISRRHLRVCSIIEPIQRETERPFHPVLCCSRYECLVARSHSGCQNGGLQTLDRRNDHAGTKWTIPIARQI